MAIIIEDGSIVANANSFVSEADFNQYVTDHSIILTDTAENLLRRAAEFIVAKETSLKGRRVDRDQALPYPRTDLTIDGWYWRSDEIPRQVTQLQILLAVDKNSGIDLYNRPEPTNKTVKRERIEGAVEVEYSVKEGGNGRTSANSEALALMSQLLVNNGLVLQRI